MANDKTQVVAKLRTIAAELYEIARMDSITETHRACFAAAGSRIMNACAQISAEPATAPKKPKKNRRPQKPVPSPSPANVDHAQAQVMCIGKRAYGSARKALVVAASAGLRRGIKLRIYDCPLCGKFHITKNTDEASRHHGK